MKTRTTVLTAPLLAFALVLYPDDVPAQTPPAACKPNPGAWLECSAVQVTPYTYLPGNCAGSNYQKSSSEANSIWEATYLPSIQQCPGSQYSDVGYASQGSPKCMNGPCGGGYPQATTCGGGGTYASPTIDSSTGLETSSWLIKEVEYDEPAPSCGTHHPAYFWGAVRRDRTLVCPRGSLRSGGFCYQGWLDIAKNLGPQCPTCGNPVSPGTGNKYQKEVDYTGAGSSLLRFERHYNSLLRRDNRDVGYYGGTTLFDTFGNGAFVQLSKAQGSGYTALPAGSPERLDAAFASHVGFDAIGAGWRHTYQRTIRYIANASSVTTAFAYREDGRVYSFIKFNGAYVPQADVADRLVRTAT